MQQIADFYSKQEEAQNAAILELNEEAKRDRLDADGENLGPDKWRN